MYDNFIYTTYKVVFIFSIYLKSNTNVLQNYKTMIYIITQNYGSVIIL